LGISASTAARYIKSAPPPSPFHQTQRRAVLGASERCLDLLAGPVCEGSAPAPSN